MQGKEGRIGATAILAFELVLLSILIIYKSINASNGYLTADSTSYLSLAQNLLQGNGFYTTGFGVGPGSDKQFFAVWPVGYPVLIYLLSLVLKTSVFWSSKIINIVCLALIFFLIRKIAKQNSWIVGLVFFLFPILEFFTYSWSEIPFVTALFYLLYFIDRYLNANKFWVLAPIFISATAMFLFRYIGYMSVPLLFFVTLVLLLRKEYKKGILVGIISSVVGILIYLYLQHNKAITGYMTGMERVPALETGAQFIIMLVVGFYFEFEFIQSINFLPVVLIIAAILIYRRQLGNLISSLFSKQRFLFPRMKDLFFIGAVTYLLLLIYNRRQAFFDNLDIRLLGPGMILLLTVFVYYALLRLNRSRYILTISLTVIAISSYTVSLGALLYSKQQGTEVSYKVYSQRILDRYASVPTGSVVLCGNRHISYLRPDLVLVFPYYEPFNNISETWSVFLSRVKSHFPQKTIYLLAEDGDGMHPFYDKSIRDFVASHPGNKLYKF